MFLTTIRPKTRWLILPLEGPCVCTALASLPPPPNFCGKGPGCRGWGAFCAAKPFSGGGGHWQLPNSHREGQNLGWEGQVLSGPWRPALKACPAFCLHRLRLIEEPENSQEGEVSGLVFLWEKAAIAVGLLWPSSKKKWLKMDKQHAEQLRGSDFKTGKKAPPLQLQHN